MALKRLLLASLCALTLSAHAGLVKWVDESGTVHYSDQPPPDTRTETVRNVAGKDAPAAPAASAPKSVAEREAELKRARQEKQTAEQAREQEAARAAERQRNCAAARQNLQAMQEGGRIVTYDANGERTFLDDDARAARIEAAQQAVNQACN